LKPEIGLFNGFDQELFKFLRGLQKNNSVEWFHKHKEQYQKFLVEPAKAFAIDLAPFLSRLNPAIRTEPKFNETLMRMNKDMRFAKGEPYRNYFLIHFGRFKLDSEFFLYFEAGEAQMGLFINQSKGEDLYFRQSISKYKNEILNLFEKYNLNNKFSFHYFKKMETVKAVSKFDAKKHFDLFEKHEMILLQKVKMTTSKTLFSSAIVVEMINMVLSLYPLYCFAISPQPLKELQRFEENF
jgi:hypothetical protein